MDEYIGLSKDAPQGFGIFLKDRLFSKLPFKSVNYITDCDEYSKKIKKYPIDIVCMGIGENGHIAFNDPHIADFDDNEVMKIVELDLKCRNQQVNDGCFKNIDEVPTHAMTLLASDIDELKKTFEIFKIAKNKCPNLLGIHLEGPYFSKEQAGAQDPRY